MSLNNILRLLVVGAVIFLANAGLLVLQLVAGRLLAPFLGSSLETWTVIIGSFLAGIATGNAVGGRIADARPSTRMLAVFLFLGAVGAIWMVMFPRLLASTELYMSITLGLRIPLLAVLLCFPVAFVLSLLTPLTIRLGVPSVARTGGVAGLIFALSTLGCLLGNYITGFVLIPKMNIDSIVFQVAALFAATGIGTLIIFQFAGREKLPVGGAVSTTETDVGIGTPENEAPEEQVRPVLPMSFACAIVFVCSFAGMTLEFASTRLIAQILGVSLYTWTGVIGVMLAGTACGNFLGGQLADWARNKSTESRQSILGACMIAASIFCVLSLVMFGVMTRYDLFKSYSLIWRIIVTTFALFFGPMFLLGMISPQVIRLAVVDVASTGRVAGRIYAYSTLGAILGTFATGYLLISAMGVVYTILLCAVMPLMGLILLRGVFKEQVLLYGTSAALGGVFGGVLLQQFSSSIGTQPDGTTMKTILETNYYTIRMGSEDIVFLEAEHVPAAAVAGIAATQKSYRFRCLYLDHLLHSVVDLNDPDFLYYAHEHIQVEMVRRAVEEKPREQRVLVIGGGAYTFPRTVRGRIPTAEVDVVEIDPGVTRVAYSHFGLDKNLDIKSYHMDGRQFVAEKAAANTYDLITLDAVNDYSVPSHLLTREFNDAVKKTMVPDGVFLVTVIDLVEKGKLWKASLHTLRQSFQHVELVFPTEVFNEQNPEKMERNVIVLYASDRPLDRKTLDAIVQKQTGNASRVYVVPPDIRDKLLSHHEKLILTDQYAPVDNLMADVFKTADKPKKH